MYREVYIDVIFLVNFLMDYFLLRLTGQIFHMRKKRIRYVLAAAAGALFSCVLLLFPGKMGNTAGILLQGVCAIFMLRIGPGFRKSGLMIKGMIGLYLTAFLFGGFWEAVSEKRIFSPLTFLILTAVIYLTLDEIRIWYDCVRARMRNLYTVTLVYQGKRWDTCGFYDTGNLLYDPVAKKPVSVVRAEALKEVLPAEIIEKLKYITQNPGELEHMEILRLKPHLLSFCTVSEQKGLLVAITLDELCIHTPREEIRISNPVFALQYGTSALESEYKVLINSRLL